MIKISKNKYFYYSFLLNIIFFSLPISNFLFSTGLNASDKPIIFLHGHKSTGRPGGHSDLRSDKTKGGWGTWYPRKRSGALFYSTAMSRILDEGYGGYVSGWPLNCDAGTELYGRNYSKIIYNFSYYNRGGVPGVIGDDNIIKCIFGVDSRTGLVVEKGMINDRYFIDVYRKASESGSFAHNLSVFIEKVLRGSYGDEWLENPDAKVDVVAHSMGGIVTRFAIKYLNLPSGEPVKNRIRKLLMIATPNRPYEYPNGELIHITFTPCQEWQIGEHWEMGISRGREILFRELSTGEEGRWCDLLGYNDSNSVEMATIAGNRHRLSIFGHPVGPDDGIVDVKQVEIPCCKNCAIIHASHDHAIHMNYGLIDDIGAKGEYSLTECSFTENFIKRWIIDDVEYVDVEIKDSVSNQ